MKSAGVARRTKVCDQRATRHDSLHHSQRRGAWDPAREWPANGPTARSKPEGRHSEACARGRRAPRREEFDKCVQGVHARILISGARPVFLRVQDGSLLSRIETRLFCRGMKVEAIRNTISSDTLYFNLNGVVYGRAELRHG